MDRRVFRETSLPLQAFVVLFVGNSGNYIVRSVVREFGFSAQDECQCHGNGEQQAEEADPHI